MNLRTALIGCLAAISIPAMAIDFAGLEAMVAAAKSGSSELVNDPVDCKAAYQNQEGFEPPSDFDFCQVERQQSLVKSGLYLAEGGDIKPLPVHAGSVVAESNVVVPVLVRDDVAPMPATPFVIDLE